VVPSLRLQIHQTLVLPWRSVSSIHFYTRKEIATRISILYTGNILATAFTGLTATGMFYGWAVLEATPVGDGCPIVPFPRNLLTSRLYLQAFHPLVATCAVWSLPDTPLTTRWLSQEERIFAHERIQRGTVNHNSIKVSTWEGLRQGAADPRAWVFALMLNLRLAANRSKNFFPTVVETLGFGAAITLVGIYLSILSLWADTLDHALSKCGTDRP